jgi:glycosyltransferase involved in cell wall biosynthesis
MVSIIVPVYNIKEYLLRCVESLVGQSFADLEILLVNDGSTDGSGELCDQLAQTDSRIRVIHKKNGGLSDARNVGLDQATGKWILFVDGDDYLVRHAVQRLMEHAREDVDFVQFFYRETEDCQWQGDPDQPAWPTEETDKTKLWQRLYELGGVAASSCTKLWNRRIFEGVRFKKGILHEDEELLNRVLPQCSRVIYTQLELYGYFMRPGSIVHSGFRKKSMDVFPILETRVEILTEQGCEELARETRVRLFRTAAWQYCLAKKGGFRGEAKELKSKILTLSKEPGLALSGQYGLLYKLSKITSVAPALYYLLRRVTGKT